MAITPDGCGILTTAGLYCLSVDTETRQPTNFGYNPNMQLDTDLTTTQLQNIPIDYNTSGCFALDL